MEAIREQRIAEIRRWLPVLVAARDALVLQHSEIEEVIAAALSPIVFMPPANRAVFGLEQAIEALTHVIARVTEVLEDADEEEPSLA